MRGIPLAAYSSDEIMLEKVTCEQKLEWILATERAGEAAVGGVGGKPV